MKRFIFTALLLTMLLFVSAEASHAAPPAQGADFPISGGHFFTQTAQGEGGFSVVDDAQAAFWSEFQRLGGAETVGYPISQRFVYDGFVTQAFQKLVLQWRPEVGEAWPLNVFDELSDAGHDDALYVYRQTPYPLQNFDRPGWTGGQIISNRQALLDKNPAIRARYFSMSDPLNVFGLPTSRVENMGNHYALRTQRAVFQQWKEDVPWASPGQVTIANGGNLAKELGWLSSTALQPEPLPGNSGSPEWAVQALRVNPDDPGVLYALQARQEPGGMPPRRLLRSTDGGQTWAPFAMPLPDCAFDIALGTSRPTELYVATCNGVGEWVSGTWEQRTEEAAAHVAISSEGAIWAWSIKNPNQELFAVYENDETRFVSGPDANGPGIDLTSFGFDPNDSGTIYAVAYDLNDRPVVARGDLNGNWEYFDIPLEGWVGTSIAIDDMTGDLFISTIAKPEMIWRSANPTASPIGDVQWEDINVLERRYSPRLLTVGHYGDSQLLYYTLRDSNASDFAAPALYRFVVNTETTPPTLPIPVD